MNGRLLVLLLLISGLAACSIPADDSSGGDSTPDQANGIAAGVNVDDAGLPLRFGRSADGHRLVAGAGSRSGFYDIAAIRRIDLTFSQSDWWAQLVANYQSEKEIPAALSYEGAPLAFPVGVRFKGFTSYNQNRTQKKSFNLAIDYEAPDQELQGYQNLNLNCAFDDDAFMREIIYEAVNQNYIPAAANNYVELYINGEYWGIYVSSQQLDGDFIAEWFLSDGGTRWRAEPVAGMNPGGGGGGFGTGKSGLNYLGTSVASYQPYYTLKKASKDDPWSDLVAACTKLNETSESSHAEVAEVLDVDRSLWFLACEIVFADEDSYVNKGGTDYYAYWESESGRLVPLEYDGNSCLLPNLASWGPFYNASNRNFPLLSKLLAVSSFRQRYLAHLRTILDERFNPDFMSELIDRHAALIGGYIQADPKKMMTYAAHVAAIGELKEIVRSRHDRLLADAEVSARGAAISDVRWSVDNAAWAAPTADQAVTVTAAVSCGSGVATVLLYGATGVVGNFSTIRMADDGAHGDGASGDGVYGGTIPAQAAKTRVRFYIEATAGDAAGTRTYEPAGAEHDVYSYSVQ